MEKLFENRNISKIEGINTWYNNLIYCKVKRVNQNINLYDSKNGLNFKELSLNTLAQNNISVQINTHVTLDGGIADYPDLKQK